MRRIFFLLSACSLITPSAARSASAAAAFRGGGGGGGGAVAAPRSKTQKTQPMQVEEYREDDACLVRQKPPSRAHFKMVTSVALVNALINTLRPDDGISWQMRLPRIFWEISIATVARSASAAVSPSLYLLLSIMTGTTALVDIFIWAPLYASFSTFETCTGGWLTGRPHICTSDFTKGFSRLLASGQSLFGGIFYLMTAIVSWQEYSTIRQDANLKSQVEAIDALMERHK